MVSINRIGKTIQALSVDVAAGAICSSAMFCRLMAVEPLPWAQLLVLGGTVLLIYTIDHQLDVYKMRSLPISGRHRFHWHNRYLLRPFAVILAILLALSAFVWLKRVVLLYGLLLAGAVGAYLLVVSRLPERKAKKWFHKEILIAVLYTAGVWGSVAVLAVPVRPFVRLSGVLFGLLALQNLMIFSYFEWEEDVSQGQRSLARTWGKNRVRTGLLLLTALLTSLMVVGWSVVDTEMEQTVFFTFGLMFGALTALVLFPAYFRPHHRYRWVGDGIFLLAAWALFG